MESASGHLPCSHTRLPACLPTLPWLQVKSASALPPPTHTPACLPAHLALQVTALFEDMLAQVRGAVEGGWGGISTWWPAWWGVGGQFYLGACLVG